MALDKKVFKTRTLSAIVFAIIMLLGFFYNNISFSLLCSIIVFFIVKEWTELMVKIDDKRKSFLPLFEGIFASIFFLGFFYYFFIIHDISGNDAMFKLLVLFDLFIGFFILFLILINNDFKRLFFPVKIIIGLLFVTFSFALLLPLYIWHIPFIILFSIWINDTMAYLIGSWIGKTPLAANISPNKTWEGTLGGIVITVFIAFVVSFFYHGDFEHYFRPFDLVMLALISSVFGTLGDLVQSKLKRWAHVKDSGHIMPGHGGLYDRFDSFVFAIPFVSAYLYFFY